MNLPLPHLDHLLQDDVARLRAALALLDGHAAATARQWAETLAERDITQARALQEALTELTLLLAAVTALRGKLIAASVSATPEERAYLASALDKLAGQVGLLDITQATDAARQTLRTALDDLRQGVAEDADALRREVLGVIAQREANAVGVITSASIVERGIYTALGTGPRTGTGGAHRVPLASGR